MKIFFNVFFILFLTFPSHSQESGEDISELEELEQELQILEQQEIEKNADFQEVMEEPEQEFADQKETKEEPVQELTEEEFIDEPAQEFTEEEFIDEPAQEFTEQEGIESLDTEEGEELVESVEAAEEGFGESVDSFSDVKTTEKDEPDAFGGFDEVIESEFSEFEGDEFEEEGLGDDFVEESEFSEFEGEEFEGEEFEDEDLGDAFAKEGELKQSSEEPSTEAFGDTTSEELSTSASFDSPTELPQDPGPNLKKEKEIYNAYQYIKNYSQVGENWSMATQGRESENYQIQMGDNLWDISLTLFGNPYFWPKIWSLNSKITNPHEIRPGQNLLFIEGSLEQAPILAEGEIPEEPEVIEEEFNEEELLAEELPALPELEAKRPPLKMIPPSLAPWGSSQNATDDFALDKLSKRTFNVADILEATTYLAEIKDQGLGKIIEIEGGLNTANLYQYVYIESNTLSPGEVVLALNYREPIKLDGEILGHPVEVQGLIEVVESVGGDKPVFKAMVKKLVNPVRLGAQVLRKSLPAVRINSLAPVSNVAAKIIGAEYDNDRKVLGTNTVIYLDRGANEGIQQGAKLQILKNHKLRRNNSKVEALSDTIGQAYVVDVQESVSTAVITDAMDYIMVGDLTGSEAVLSLGSGNQELESYDNIADPEQNNSFEEEFEDMSGEDADSDFL